MKILAVDTSTRHCSVAICRDLELIAETTLFRRQTHSKHLLEMIHQTVSLSGIKIGEIDAYAVTRGPGSFTGLRIGLSCVKGLAYALDKPVVSVSSLEVLAYQAINTPMDDHLLICPILDARKKEIYCAVFSHLNTTLTQVIPEMVLSPEKLSRHIHKPCYLIGDGAVMYKDLLATSFKNTVFFAPAHQNYIRAHNVAILGFKRLMKGEADNLLRLVPEYIRKSDAERNFPQIPA